MLSIGLCINALSAIAEPLDQNAVYAIQDDYEYVTVTEKENGYDQQKSMTKYNKHNLVKIDPSTGQVTDYGRLHERISGVSFSGDGRLLLQYPVGVLKGKGNTVVYDTGDVQSPSINLPILLAPITVLILAKGAGDRIQFYTPYYYKAYNKSGYIKILNDKFDLVADIPVEPKGVGISLASDRAKGKVYILTEGSYPDIFKLRVVNTSTIQVEVTINLQKDQRSPQAERTPDEIIGEELSKTEFYGDVSKIPEGEEILPQPNSDYYIAGKMIILAGKLFILTNSSEKLTADFFRQKIYVYDINQKYKLLKELPLEGSPYEVAFTALPKMNQLYILDHGKIKVMDAATLQINRSFSSEGVTNIGATGNDKLICRYRNGDNLDIKIYDARKGRFTFTIPGHFSSISAIIENI